MANPLRSLLARYLPEPYLQILTDPFTFRDNPVLARDARRDTRRRDRILLLFFALTVPVAFFFGLIWLMDRLRDSSHGRSVRYGIPPHVGGSYGALIFALFTATHFWFVWHAVFRRTNLFFLQEYRKNTLQSLLCTRIPPFQLVLQSSVYPFRQGMMIAFAGLPFYLFALSIGGASLLDVIGLYIYFAMISFRPPRWSVPVFAGISADDILKRMRSGRQKTWGEFWLVNGIWIGLVGGWYLQWAFGPGWMGLLLWPLWTIVPHPLQILSQPFPLTWVVCTVRLLFTPLPYYAYALPPIAAVVPLYLAARALAIWESSINLRTGDTDAGTQFWDLPAYWRLRRAYGLAVPFLLLGFLWHPYVESGLTASLVFLNGAPGSLALAGLLWLAGSLAALVVWARMRELAVLPLLNERDGSGETPMARRIRYVAAPAAAIYGMFFAACLLAGMSPFPAPVRSLLASLLAVTAAGALFVRAIPPARRAYFLWLFAPLVGWLIPGGPIGGLVASASPLAGLLSLSEHAQRILDAVPQSLILQRTVVLPWTSGAALTAMLGLFGGLLAARRGRSTASEPSPELSFSSVPSGKLPAAAVPSAPHAAPHAVEAPPVVAVQPARIVQIEAPPVVTKKFKPKKDTAVALRLIAWVQGFFDNALTAKEMRVLLRGRLDVVEVWTYPVLLALITGLVAYRSDVTVDMLTGAGQLFFGWDLRGLPAMFGGMVTCFSMALAFGISLASTTVCGTAFARERDKSTLGFVLVTPLRTPSILWGKLIGMLTPSLLACAVVSAWNVLLTIPVFAVVDPVRTLLGLGFAVTTPLLLAFLGGTLGLAWSTVFRRESDAAAMAFLQLLFTIIGIFIAMGAVYGIYWTSTPWIDAPRLLVWYLLLVLAVAIEAPLALAFTRWRLDRARHGDVAFESATVQK